MTQTQTCSLGDLLRRYRFEAGLTQETLAERSGLSTRAISDLERGLRTAPRRETVRLLANTLGLNAAAREGLDAAARRPRRQAVRRKASDETPESDADLSTRLVGRLREVQALREKLETALAGRGGLVLLSGEPGIGKTRLLEELAIEAAQRGMLALWGRCWENGGAPPFWPWMEVLRGLVRSQESRALRDELGSGASLIAQLAPQVHERLPDLPPAPELEPREARFQLFDSITIALQNVARSQPLVLVLDDLHWADKPSLLLLEFLLPHVGNSRILILGTYRDTDLDRHHPLGEVLGSLRRERSFEVMPIEGLTVAAISELLNSYLDQPLSTGESGLNLARALWQATEGNPLFVREQLRYLQVEDRLPHAKDDRDSAAWLEVLGLPQGVRDVISLRLSRLSPSTHSLLTLAAVIGREFDVTTLQQSSELSEAEVDNALDEAQTARVVEETTRTTDRYRFTHALFREALYTDLPARRRRRLHRQVAEAVERTYVGDLDAHVSELAYHYGEAQALLGNDHLAHYSLLAGKRALESRAYEEGLVHCQRGLAARAGQPMDDEQAALLFGLGCAQAATLELPRASEVVANLSRAFEYYAQAGDVERAVAVAECPVDALPGQPVGAARLIANALVLVGRDSHAAGRLLSRYARMVAIEEGNYQAAAEACDRALAIARRAGDVHLEIQTLGNGAEADLNFMRWQGGLAKCMRAMDLARRTDAVEAEVLARFFASILLWFLGDLTQASAQAIALLTRAEQLRDRRWRVSALWIAGTLARYTGNWPAALDMIDQGLALLPADPRLLWTRALLEHDAGNAATVQAMVTKLLDVVPLTNPAPDLAQASTALVIAIVADAGLGEGKLRAAEDAAEAILLIPTATPVVSRVARASLAVMAVRRGDVAAARRHYPALEAARGTIIYQAMPGDRLLGLLAATMGEHGIAVRHFESALSFCRDSGCEPELARTCYDFANVLDTRVEYDRVRDLLDEALTIAHKLGMQPLAGRVLARRERQQA